MLFDIENETLMQYTGHEKTVYVPNGVKVIGTTAFRNSNEI